MPHRSTCSFVTSGAVGDALCTSFFRFSPNGRFLALLLRSRGWGMGGTRVPPREPTFPRSWTEFLASVGPTAPPRLIHPVASSAPPALRPVHPCSILGEGHGADAAARGTQKLGLPGRPGPWVLGIKGRMFERCRSVPIVHLSGLGTVPETRSFPGGSTRQGLLLLLRTASAACLTHRA